MYRNGFHGNRNVPWLKHCVHFAKSFGKRKLPYTYLFSQEHGLIFLHEDEAKRTPLTIIIPMAKPYEIIMLGLKNN